MELKQFNKCRIPYIEMLLIVPYGIETEDEGTFLYSPISFNRTLWN